jgi:hypothetical protein
MNAKKVTTIVLFFVVLLLLGSTIYVSIILTSETDAPLTTNTRASELGNGLNPANETTTPDPANPDETNPGADPAEDPFTDPFAEPATGLGDGATPDPAAAPTGADGLPLPADTDVIPQNDNTLAYANPTPDPGTGSDASESATTDATDDRQPAAGLEGTPDASMTVSPTSALPDTGLGQPTNTPTPTFVPTQPPSPTTQTVQPTETKSMPVAGSIGGSILAVVVAGATIITALFL